MKKYAYTINGITSEMTKADLIEHYRHLLRDEEVSEALVLATVDHVIERLMKYDGDPYGHIKQINPTLWSSYHKQEANGTIQTIKAVDLTCYQEQLEKGSHE